MRSLQDCSQHASQIPPFKRSAGDYALRLVGRSLARYSGLATRLLSALLPPSHHLSLEPGCVVKHCALLNMVTDLHALQGLEMLLRQNSGALSHSPGEFPFLQK